MRVYRGLLSVFRIAVCGYLVVLVGLYAFQRHLLYHPDRTLRPPAEFGLADAAVEHIKTADGEDIMVWWIPPGAPEKPAFLYLHGNGGNLSYRHEPLRAPRGGWLRRDGGQLARLCGIDG